MAGVCVSAIFFYNYVQLTPPLLSLIFNYEENALVLLLVIYFVQVHYSTHYQSYSIDFSHLQFKLNSYSAVKINDLWF